VTSDESGGRVNVGDGRALAFWGDIVNDCPYITEFEGDESGGTESDGAWRDSGELRETRYDSGGGGASGPSSFSNFLSRSRGASGLLDRVTALHHLISPLFFFFAFSSAAAAEAGVGLSMSVLAHSWLRREIVASFGERSVRRRSSCCNATCISIILPDIPDGAKLGARLS